METSKLQLPETVFRLKHMPSIIYRGAHSNFWPALHGTCTLFLVLVELYNADRYSSTSSSAPLPQGKWIYRFTYLGASHT